jgi:hypothetical protein
VIEITFSINWVINLSAFSHSQAVYLIDWCFSIRIFAIRQKIQQSAGTNVQLYKQIRIVGTINIIARNIAILKVQDGLQRQVCIE